MTYDGRAGYGARQRKSSWSFIVLLCFDCILLSVHATGQSRASVVIDLSKAVGTLTNTSIGVLAPTSDSNSLGPDILPNLRAVGITSLRYPGSPGSADLYHWSTNTSVARKGSEAGVIAPGNDFGHFALFAEQLGQAVIVVNYGTNYDGSGGGQPAEAAAWVAYANGDVANMHELGPDSTGKDWHTVSYWATLRGEAPIANDDGLNFLRLHHPRPFGFKLWQIGDEPYNNGYPGGDQTGNPNLYPNFSGSPNYAEKTRKTILLSPSSYAQNLSTFARAMKTVDPSIQIGAAFVGFPYPGIKLARSWLGPKYRDWLTDNFHDWNQEVLKGACANIDFVTLPWFLQPLRKDWRTLNEPYLLDNVNFGYTYGTSHSADAMSLLGEINAEPDTSASLALIDRWLTLEISRDCAKGHFPGIALAPAGIGTWMKIDHPVVEALWVADFYAFLIESHVLNANWTEVDGVSMLSADRKRFGPVYYGLQMLHTVADAPGDLFLDVKSNSALVGAHATNRRDGYTGIMLVNKDPKYAITVKVTLKNGSIGASGKRFDYGNAQYAAGQPIAESKFYASGEALIVSIPPYTVTDLVFPNGH